MATAEYVPGLAGIVAAKSEISYIDGSNGTLEYRGIGIEDLAAKSDFLETSFLLIQGYLPAQSELSAFVEDVRANRALPDSLLAVIKLLDTRIHPMDALQSCVALLGAGEPSRNAETGELAYEASVRLIAKLPTIVAAVHRARGGLDPVAPRSDLDHAANFLYMLTGEAPHPVIAKAFDVCLILHAEHTLNASTFAGRVVGSTLASPYAVISSAIGGLSGPLHGGANEHVLTMLQEIGSIENARAYIESKVQRGERIMGVGHRLYKVKDPRVPILQGMAHDIFAVAGVSPLYSIAQEVERVALDLLSHKGIYPNVDFYSGIVYERMGIREDLFTTIFAIARVAGWLAHWREQLADNRIFRPTHLYIGAHKTPYQPISERG